MKTFAFIAKHSATYRLYHGWGNGYVVVTREHPAYELEYDSDILDRIDVHGGITYSEGINPRINCTEWMTEEPDTDDIWVIGFDTMHFYSNSLMDKKWIKQETLRLKQQIDNIK